MSGWVTSAGIPTQGSIRRLTHPIKITGISRTLKIQIPKKKHHFNTIYLLYSVDEMGKYDIPASINYVLSVTGQSSLSYVGHSMGCAVFFIAMTYHPELNSKIDVMVALAPATANGNSQTSLRYQAPFVNQVLVLVIK